MRCLALILLMAATCLAEQTVGIEGQLDVLLPAPPLKAKPADRTSALTLRIASAQARGTHIQYDLRFMGFVPGDYDLRAYLMREDGAAAGDLPPMPVAVSGILPYEHDGELIASQAEPAVRLGGYRWALGGAAALWAVCALPLFLKRRERSRAAEAPAPAPPTLADRLRPLVEKSAAGPLTADEQAQLERLLLAHWQQRLGLENLAPAEAMPRLREHPEAGALLHALEDWLHRRPGTVKVDLESVLAPYGKLPAGESATPATP